MPAHWAKAAGTEIPHDNNRIRAVDVSLRAQPKRRVARYIDETGARLDTKLPSHCEDRAPCLTIHTVGHGPSTRLLLALRRVLPTDTAHLRCQIRMQLSPSISGNCFARG